jgi:hypothetical protein
MTKSVTFDELRTMVEIVSRLTTNLQHLCQTQTAFRPDMLNEYRTLARKTMIPPTAAWKLSRAHHDAAGLTARTPA